MTCTDRPNAGQQGSCARGSRLIPTIRMSDRATKNPAEVAGLSTHHRNDEGDKNLNIQNFTTRPRKIVGYAVPAAEADDFEQIPAELKAPASIARHGRDAMTPHTLDDYLSRLEGVTPSGDGYKALCPAHDDRNPSLSICQGHDGRPLLYCHAGCSYEAIIAAMGLERSTPGPTATARQIVATYDYRDESGALLYQKVRYAPKDFRIRRSDGNGGWNWSKGKARLVLYRLPELLIAKAQGQTLFMAEGEKDADRLHSVGLTATTNIEGASKDGKRQKWQPEYSDQLAGAVRVVLLPDNDDAGRALMRTVAQQVAGKVADIRIVELPGLSAKGDVSDWLESGHTVKELLQLVEVAEMYQLDQASEQAPPPDYSDYSEAHESHQAPTDKAADSEPPAFRLTDTGNAERFAHQHRQQVRYCWEWSTWLAWDGTRWRTESGALVQALAKQTVRRIYAEAAHVATEDHAKAIAKHAMKSESSKARRDFLDLARSEDGIPIAATDLDRHPWLLNCANGTVDLQTGELRKHNPADLLTKRTEIEFDPIATAPLWRAFLDRIFAGDQALISFLQRAIGYSLTATTREQCFLILHGSGSNGKSTLLDVLLTLLGQDYAIHCDAELLLAKRHETHTTERADLAGMRLVTVIEAGDGRRLAENFIKQMTGGDRIRARRMRQDSFEFMPQFKLWLATNHRPEIRGTDYAIWRRVRLIPFEVSIPDHEKDPILPEKLKAELPGILAWAVQGCLEWQQVGLQPPDKVTAATQSYKEDMDLLAAFLADYCVIDRNARAKAGSLYAAYCEWCEQNGERPEPQRRFGQRLAERGYGREKTNGANWWNGVGLAAPHNTPDSTHSTHSTLNSVSLHEAYEHGCLYRKLGAEGAEGADLPPAARFTEEF